MNTHALALGLAFWVATIGACFPPALEQDTLEVDVSDTVSDIDSTDGTDIDDTFEFDGTADSDTADTDTTDSDTADSDTADTDTADTDTSDTDTTDTDTADTDTADTDTTDTAEPDTDTTDTDTTEVTPVRNTCGGLGLLAPGEPGGTCGPCFDGNLVCDTSDPNKNSTRCEGASVKNTCDGCGAVEPPLDSACGTCGVTVCDGLGATRCAEPSDGCETPLTCDDLACSTQKRTCIETDGTVDALCGACLESHVETNGQCVGEVVAPTGVTASIDLEDRVQVSWAASVHATGYRLYRCAGTCGDAGPWTEVLPVAIANTTYPDLTVAGPAAPSAPAVSATNNRPLDVEVTWGAVPAPPSPAYSYRVVAVGPSGESAPSLVAVGRLAERAITGYETSINGGPWLTTDGLALTDTDAAMASLSAGMATASEGTYVDRVELSLTGWSSVPGVAREYRVRAKTRFGVGAIGSASGNRVVSALTVSWERSAGSAPTDFAAIANSSGPIDSARTYTDSDSQGIPPNGVVRYYRARVAAEGAVAVTSEPVAGWRLPPPGVPQIQAVSTDLLDRVEVRWAPVNGALGYHIYRHGTRLTPEQGVSCTSSPCLYSDLDASAPNAWTAPSAVVATTNQTTGVTVTWTLPTRPRGTRRNYEVSAINPAGESAKSPLVEGWRVGPALTGIEVKATAAGADTTHFAAADAVSYSHSAAPLAVFAATTLTATRGDHRAHVKLTLSGGTLGQATTVGYQVRGQYSGGTTPWSSTASGRRATGTIGRTWEYASPLSPTVWTALSTQVCASSATTCNDTTAAGVGTPRLYRTTLAASGATSLTTASAEGFRLAFTYVDGGGDTMCAIDTSGRLWAWGQVSGQGSLTPRIRAQGPFVACTTGGSLLSYDGVGYGCGRTSLGDVFCGSMLADNPLVQRTDLGTGVKSIEIREAHACAVKGNGQAVCWGWGFAGQLGNNSTSDSPTPVTVVRSTGATLTGLEQVDVGSLHSCARTTAGALWCWGENGAGRLGDGTGLSKSHAVQVTGLTGVAETKLGLEYTCARLGTGQVRCFGRNDFGQVGDGTVDARLSPVSVLLTLAPNEALGGALQLATLDETACVRRSNALLCWGGDAYGELGDGGPNSMRALPGPTATLDETAFIAGGRWSFCAISDGDLWCWGRNSGGILGDNSVVDRASPTHVVLP